MGKQNFLDAFEEWFWSLSSQSGEGGTNGVIAVSLVILEKLKDNYDLEFSHYLSRNGMQIKGASGKKTKTILAQLGEHRPFLSEGGRTSRGTPIGIQNLLKFLEGMSLESLPANQRNNVLTDYQKFLVQRVVDFHNRKKLKIEFNREMSISQVIEAILTQAKFEKKWGPVAQHLVGAKLQLRFPSMHIENHAVNTADESTGRKGDFLINETVFHITVAPGEKIIEKCKQNLKEGYEVYVLVPTERIYLIYAGIRDAFGGKVSLVSIENFIAQNLDELGEFGNVGKALELSKLLFLYNLRVDAVEMDKSLMLEIPKSLNYKEND